MPSIKLKSPAVSAMRVILLVLILQAPVLYQIWQQGDDIKHVTADTNRVVGYIDEQTSPERVAKQEQLLNGILVRIDCNDASRLQLVIDGLVEQGLVEPFDVRANCG